MNMQMIRELLGKQEVTTDDVYNLSQKRPDLFVQKSESVFDELVSFLEDEATFSDSELRKAIDLIEQYGSESYINGETAVTYNPEAYGLMPISDEKTESDY